MATEFVFKVGTRTKGDPIVWDTVEAEYCSTTNGLEVSGIESHGERALLENATGRHDEDMRRTIVTASVDVDEASERAVIGFAGVGLGSSTVGACEEVSASNSARATTHKTKSSRLQFGKASRSWWSAGNFRALKRVEEVRHNQYPYYNGKADRQFRRQREQTSPNTPGGERQPDFGKRRISFHEQWPVEQAGRLRWWVRTLAAEVGSDHIETKMASQKCLTRFDTPYKVHAEKRMQRTPLEQPNEREVGNASQKRDYCSRRRQKALK